mmetsp:Transcript_4199/g.11863  ORF Transcript_4199/g.11863 Transcript_4199/m.11863 type:complete len:119 (+) Transcript_4199:2-358(+)
MARYAAEVGWSNLLTVVYGKALVRRNNERTRQLGECWWSEFTRGMPRDQVSLHYCLLASHQSAGLDFRFLNGPGNMNTSAPFKHKRFREAFAHLGQTWQTRHYITVDTSAWQSVHVPN